MSVIEPVSGRRKELLEAAIRVVAARGLRGLTHRAVDAEAGVAQGSTSGYYRTRLALLTALTEHVSWKLTGIVKDLEASIMARPDGLDQQANAQRVAGEVVTLLTCFVETPDLVVVQAELALEALRSPQLLEVFDPWREELSQLVTAIGTGADVAHARDRAQTTVAAFQGLLTTAMLRPESERVAYVADGARQFIELLRR